MNDIRFFRQGPFEVSRGVDVTHEYPRHWHDETLVCTLDRGGGEVFFRGNWHRTGAGCVFLIPAGEIHANRGDCDHHNLYVPAETLPGSPDPVDERGGLRQELLAICRSVITNEAALTVGTYWRRLERRAHRRPEPRVGHEPGAVRRARDFLLASLRANPALEDLEAVTGASAFHLCRAFHQTYGLPPHAFLIQARVAEARRLLRAGVPAAQAAVDAGFHDQSHLTRHFRRVYGVTPGAYRRKNVQDGSPGLEPSWRA